MGFEFTKKPTIEICGKEYECDPTNCDLITGVVNDFPQIVLTGQKIEQKHADLKNALANRETDRVEELGKGIVLENGRLLAHCRDFIQGCLGKEEYEEIFQNRKPNSTEHLEVCTYIFKHIMEGRQKVLEGYIDPPSSHVND